MSNKTWGGRFKKKLNPIVEKFNSSLSFDKILYKEDILGSKTHASMLSKQGLISKQEEKSIIKALNEIEKEIENNKHNLNEKHEDIHMFIEQLLIKKIGETGKKLHTGRSRNDQSALDMRLYARKEAKEIKSHLTNLINTLNKLSIKHKKDIMPGYTHLQQAQPISLGLYLNAYQSMFKRDLIRLENWYKLMNYSPLGAGSFAGSNLNLDREYIAEKLDFNGIIENTIDAVSDRDYIIEFSSISSIIMMHLSRLSEDIIIWSSSEFNFITLDDAFATGSSLMPNKKNPDIPELIRGKTGRIFGNLLAILTVMKGLPLSYNKDMQEDKENFFDSVNTVKKSLEVISPFLKSLNFNTKVMLKSLESGFLNATQVLEKLVLKGIAFRDAHHIVGKLVLESKEKKINFNELVKLKYKNL